MQKPNPFEGDDNLPILSMTTKAITVFADDTSQWNAAVTLTPMEIFTQTAN